MSDLHPNTGRPEFFDTKPFLDVANILVASDEPLLALKVLKMVPGFYRDFYPSEMLDLKNKILSLLATPGFYVTNPYDSLVRADSAPHVVQGTLRGRMIEQDVKLLNQEKKIPHIVDLGPGEYWLALGLKALGYRFTYQPIGLCTEAHDKAKLLLVEQLVKPLDDAPRIFVACELIEHLHHEEDIRVDCERVGCKPDLIHISTPKYTFDTRASQIDWAQKGDLGHLRTYTPDEFKKVVHHMWPEYRWQYVDSQPMHMRGFKQ